MKKATLDKDAKTNSLELRFAGNPGNGAVGIRADADIYFGQVEAGQRLLHRPHPGRAQWLQFIRGDIALLGQRFGPGDGVSIEGVDVLEIQSRANAHFLLSDLE